MDSPTAWNVNDKSDYLSINSDRLRVNYTGEVIILLLYDFYKYNIANRFNYTTFTRMFSKLKICNTKKGHNLLYYYNSFQI